MKSRKHGSRRRWSAGGFFDDMTSMNSSEFFSDEKGKRRQTRALQLCRQVQRVLGSSLAGCADEVLQDLVLESVVPAPDASRLMVNVYLGTLGGTVRLHEILERLSRVEGFLRREVASAIVRKRAPELAFNVIAPGEVSHA